MPLLFSEPYLGGIVEFDIPERLELQSQANQAINEALTGLKSYDIVLQQKGLNQYTEAAMSQYCRVMIKLDYSSAAGITNRELFDEFESFSYIEKNELYNILKDSIQTQNVVKQWRGSSVVSIGGVRAVKISFDRESTAEKGDVHVDQYFILAKDLTINLVCSYRISQEAHFKPAIEQFLASLKINIDSQQMYLQTFEGSKTSFLWPEKTIRWNTQMENEFISNTVSLDRIDTEGYTLLLSEIYTMDERITKEQLMLSFAQIATLTKTSLTKNLAGYNYKLTKDTWESDSTAYRLCYTYSVMGLNVAGVVYATILSDNSYAMIIGESIRDDNLFEMIINSL